MSVRKRKWTTAKGVEKEAWLVDYTDQNDVRHIKTFAKKKDADAYASKTDVEVRAHMHVADYGSKTIEEVGALWLKRAERELEYGTYKQYEQHLRLHIVPFIGKEKLSRVTLPRVRQFLDDLHDAGRSAPMVRAVRTSLGSILGEAQERGFSNQNAVRNMTSKRSGKVEKRRKKKLGYGVDIPTIEEINAIIDAAEGRFKPLIITAIYTGLRSSELRGLRWADIDLKHAELHVTQRADSYHVIGMPKSDTSQRTVPLPPEAVSALREWKLRYPKGDKKLDLVFPNTLGNIEAHGNIIRSGLIPTMLRAGVTVDTGRRDGTGKPILAAKYTGLHAFRHWFASWCLNREKDGGRGLLPNRVQKLLGHSTIGITMDTYGHLFKDQDGQEELAQAEKRLRGAKIVAT